MARVCFDYGHGGNDPGAVYRGRKEKEDNLEIGKSVAVSLRNHGVIIDETRDGDKTLSLKERSDFEKKNKYDFFISFHRNAFKPEKARGIEIFIYSNKNKDSNSLALKIQKSLVEVGFKDRGVKTGNFHVLRETFSPAILMEIGFIDNTLDNELFVNRKEQIVQAISKSILEQLNIDCKNKGEDVLYRVMVGSFKIRENAEKRVEDLRKTGFDANIKIGSR